MRKIETIHERISLLVERFGNDKNTVFASLIGSNEGSIRGYIKGVLPKQDILEKIVRKFDIDAEWLLTGNGEMLKTDTVQAAASKQPAATSSELTDLAFRLGEQVNENKHLHEKNMSLSTEIDKLKSEIEQLKNARSRVVEYSIPETSLMVAAENQEEYNIAKK